MMAALMARPITGSAQSRGNRYGVCPDNAVFNLGPDNRYAIDYDYCKGCGLCVAECPSGAIDLVPEDT
jgi:Pyruvate/2-oxoacid:ferredoxin oxidoreductase delta subunit